MSTTKKPKWRWLRQAEILRPDDEVSARGNNPKLKEPSKFYCTARVLGRTGEPVGEITTWAVARRRVVAKKSSKKPIRK